MRLIDVDALADALFEKRRNYPQWVADVIGNMPDAVVRCKDCRHCYFASNRIPCEQSLVCAKTGCNITPDWFCAGGERRDDNA